MAKLALKFYFLIALFVAAVFVQIVSAQTRVLPSNREQVLISFAPVVREVAPAVVNIYAKIMPKQRTRSLFDDPIFRRFFGTLGFLSH